MFTFSRAVTLPGGHAACGTVLLSGWPIFSLRVELRVLHAAEGDCTR
jgi:hypothetical protein